MQKIVFILLIVILTSGCSVLKRNADSNNRLFDYITSEKTIESVEKQNITAHSFFIQKAELNIQTQDGVIEKLFGSFKYESPDKYLISIKSRTGIEAVRVFISKDTVLINDRINKKMYCGSVSQMKHKYGISVSEIPIIFGDFIFDKTQDKIFANCTEGSMEIDTFLKGAKITYIIDCSKEKLKKASITGSLNRDVIDILYSGYLKYRTGIIPGAIQINDLQRRISIGIRFRKIETPWNGKIDFISGKQYEILQLP